MTYVIYTFAWLCNRFPRLHNFFMDVLDHTPQAFVWRKSDGSYIPKGWDRL